MLSRTTVTCALVATLAALVLGASACGSRGAGGTTAPPGSRVGTTPNPPPGSAAGSDPASSSSTSASVRATTSTRLDGHITVLEIGDSLGEDLGYGLSYALARDPKVHLVQAAVGDTGLVNTAYYDWPRHLSAELSRYHPQVLIVFLGGNDVQNFYKGAIFEGVGSPGWVAAYGARVASIMREATSKGAKVLWVGMPPMADPTFSSEMRMLDGIYAKEAKKHPAATYFSSWSYFSNAAGDYVASKVLDGRTITLRDPDGIHLDYDGGDLLGVAVVKEMDHLYGLGASPPTSLP